MGLDRSENKDDFQKYRNRIPILRLNVIFNNLTNQFGQKVIYSNVSREYNISQIKESKISNAEIDFLIQKRK